MHARLFPRTTNHISLSLSLSLSSFVLRSFYSRSPWKILYRSRRDTESRYEDPRRGTREIEKDSYDPKISRSPPRVQCTADDSSPDFPRGRCEARNRQVMRSKRPDPSQRSIIVPLAEVPRDSFSRRPSFFVPRGENNAMRTSIRLPRRRHLWSTSRRRVRSTANVSR